MTRQGVTADELEPALHPALAGLVESLFGYDQNHQPGSVHHGLPGPSVTVVISLDVPLDVAWARVPHSRRLLPALAAGLHLSPSVVRASGRERGIQLALTPRGCRRLLGVPAAGLAGYVVDHRDLDPALAALQPRLAQALTWSERFALLQGQLVRRALDAAPRSDAAVQHAWQLIVASGGRRRIEEVSSELGWSRRRLLTQFRSEYGVAPKELARVARFDVARRLAAAGTSLGEVAATAGYADQAHLNREWRSLAGRTPTATLAGDYQPG